jgi:hypothetical protein
MKWRKKMRVPRYAGLFARLEKKVDAHWRHWARVLQVRSERLSLRQQYVFLMLFCLGVTVLCVLLIFNAFK